MTDVNGATFHLLLAEQDWFAGRPGAVGPAPDVSGSPRDLEWAPESGLTLRRNLDFKRSGLTDRLTFDDRRGVDRDRYGTWWVVSEDRRGVIGTRDDLATVAWPLPPTEPTGVFVDKAPAGADMPLEFGGLAVTADHRLVVGVMNQPGLLVFDLFAGGAPTFVRWTASAPFVPIDIAATADGGVLILDTDPLTVEAPRVWALDGLLRPIETDAGVEPSPFFAECDPADPDPTTTEESAAGVARPWVLESGGARSIATLPGGDYLVLDVQAATVRRHRGEDVVGSLDLDEALLAVVGVGAPDHIWGHDIAVLTDSRGAQLFISDRSGEQVFAFDIEPAGFVVRADNYPLRRHRGRGLVAAGSDVWFDTETDWHPLLDRGRPRFATTGVVETAYFDSAIEQCRWHRVFVDGCLPADTSVRIESRAADDPAEMSTTPWRVEPAPYRRLGGSELPLDAADSHLDVDSTGTWETLLQRADGRYCQLRITLHGPGSSSPRIWALRLVFPRFSYLHEYLPAVYAERDRPTRFLERFLANPEGLFTDLEQRVANAQLLFDHRTVPKGYLNWLASWLGHEFEDDLTPARKRLFLANAIELFRSRGTVPGLIQALTLVLSDCPEALFDDTVVGDAFGIRVLESFSTRRLGVPIPDGPGEIGASVVADPNDRWTPEWGVSELHRRFRVFLEQRYGTAGATGSSWPPSPLSLASVSPSRPADPAAAADWAQFLSGQFGLRTVELDASDLATYQRYLLQRYGRTDHLAKAYGRPVPPSSFDAIGFPTTLPESGPVLEDWFAVITLAVPIERSAHRFTVLLPIDINAPVPEQSLLVARARRVVERERPTHTGFDVRPYWAAFQLGDARLGYDSQLGQSSRAAAMVLGRGQLGRSSTPGPTQRFTDTGEVCS